MTTALRNRRALRSPSRRAQWRSLIDYLLVRDETSPYAPRIRARQLQAILNAAPFAALAVIVNAAIIVYILTDQMHPWLGYGWFAVLVLFLVVMLRRWHLSRDQLKTEAPAESHAAIGAQAALLALAWSVVAIVGLSESSPYQQAFVTAVTAGMLCGGAFVLAAIPGAGYAYALILGIASALGLFASHNPYSTALAVLMINYAAVVTVGIHFMARSFVGRIEADLRTDQQNQVIGLLLRDFEEHASDLLWETGYDGRLVRPSSRLLEALGISESRLGERAFVEWLALGAEEGALDDAASSIRLRELFEGTEPFRDITIRLPSIEGGRWWSLTAKPLIDSDGEKIGWRGVLSDVTDARDAHRRLLRMAHHDSLTGLANRAHFTARLEQALADTAQRQRCAVLCLDLDGFKSVNDSLGHGFGDALLHEVGKRLRSAVRDDDLVARIGGDEFAILLSDAMMEADACAVANRILQNLAEPIVINRVTAPIGVSIGIVPVASHPEVSAHADQLMVAADLALYAAKAAGKGNWQMYEPEMGTRNRRRLTIEQALRGAIDRDELSLHYQAQVGLRSWRIVCFEALLRWDHPTLGRVSPAEFVPIAEEAGLIDRLGDWVLHRACAEAVNWPETIQVAVNVSPLQAMTGAVAGSVEAALEASGLAPQRLELEITETVFVSEGAIAIAVLRRLKALGVKVALDDFGIGYSSLAYLRRFPFDTLKIDRAFIREVVLREDTNAIVRTIVALARVLQIETVAEGVEEPDQLLVLREQGCDTIQGYYTSVPIPAHEVPALLAGWPDEAPAEALGPPPAPFVVRGAQA